MDLKLNNILTTKDFKVEDIPSDLVVDFLYAATMELDNQLDELTLDRDIQDMDTYVVALDNLTSINNYIQKYGVTHHACELLADGDMVAMEGVVDSVKEIIVKTAKAIWKFIKRIVEFVKKLFGKSDESKSKADKLTDDIMNGNTSSLKKLAENLDKDKSKKPSTEAMTSDDRMVKEMRTAMSSMPDQWSDGHSNARKMINNKHIDLNKLTIYVTHNSFNKVFGKGRIDDLRKDLQEYLASDLVKVGGDKDLTDPNVILSIIDENASIYKTTTGVIGALRNLKLNRINENDITPDTARDYILKVLKEMDIDNSDYLVRKCDDKELCEICNLYIKAYVKLLKEYRIMRDCVNKCMYIFASIRPDREDGSIDKFKVTVKVAYPEYLLKKLQDAWNCPQLDVKQVILGGSLQESSYFNGSSMVCIGIKYVAELFGDSPDRFIDTLYSHRDKLFKNMTYVEKFMNVLVHESRHAYQYAVQKYKLDDKDKRHTYYIVKKKFNSIIEKNHDIFKHMDKLDIDKDKEKYNGAKYGFKLRPGESKEDVKKRMDEFKRKYEDIDVMVGYQASTYEIDARRAAERYKVTEEDREFVKKLLSEYVKKVDQKLEMSKKHLGIEYLEGKYGFTFKRSMC